jgi:hypothetical protein
VCCNPLPLTPLQNPSGVAGWDLCEYTDDCESILITELHETLWDLSVAALCVSCSEMFLLMCVLFCVCRKKSQKLGKPKWYVRSVAGEGPVACDGVLTLVIGMLTRMVTSTMSCKEDHTVLVTIPCDIEPLGSVVNSELEPVDRSVHMSMNFTWHEGSVSVFATFQQVCAVAVKPSS